MEKRICQKISSWKHCRHRITAKGFVEIDLKPRAAAIIISRGMRIEEVMILMGHTKIETTLIYCNIKTK